MQEKRRAPVIWITPMVDPSQKNGRGDAARSSYLRLSALLTRSGVAPIAQQRRRVIEDRIRARERHIAPVASATQHDRREPGSMRGFDVVWRVADEDGAIRLRAGA